jgi:hypothetical protein
VCKWRQSGFLSNNVRNPWCHHINTLRHRPARAGCSGKALAVRSGCACSNGMGWVSGGGTWCSSVMVEALLEIRVRLSLTSRQSSGLLQQFMQLRRIFLSLHDFYVLTHQGRWKPARDLCKSESS